MKTFSIPTFHLINQNQIMAKSSLHPRKKVMHLCLPMICTRPTFHGNVANLVYWYSPGPLVQVHGIPIDPALEATESSNKGWLKTQGCVIKHCTGK